LSDSGKTSRIQSFKDPCIATSIPVIDLVDAISPGSIDYELVTAGESDEVRGLFVYVCFKIYLPLSFLIENSSFY